MPLTSTALDDLDKDRPLLPVKIQGAMAFLSDHAIPKPPLAAGGPALLAENGLAGFDSLAGDPGGPLGEGDGNGETDLGGELVHRVGRRMEYLVRRPGESRFAGPVSPDYSGAGAMRCSMRVAEFARILGKGLPPPEFWRIRLRTRE